MDQVNHQKSASFNFNVQDKDSEGSESSQIKEELWFTDQSGRIDNNLEHKITIRNIGDIMESKVNKINKRQSTFLNINEQQGSPSNSCMTHEFLNNDSLYNEARNYSITQHNLEFTTLKRLTQSLIKIIEEMKKCYDSHAVAMEQNLKNLHEKRSVVTQYLFAVLEKVNVSDIRFVKPDNQTQFRKLLIDFDSTYPKVHRTLLEAISLERNFIYKNVSLNEINDTSNNINSSYLNASGMETSKKLLDELYMIEKKINDALMQYLSMKQAVYDSDSKVVDLLYSEIYELGEAPPQPQKQYGSRFGIICFPLWILIFFIISFSAVIVVISILK